MECKYCESEMKSQGTDRIENEYIQLFVCSNEECKAIFKHCKDANGKPINHKMEWFEQAAITLRD